jgi:hypothetical protein
MKPIGSMCSAIGLAVVLSAAGCSSDSSTDTTEAIDTDDASAVSDDSISDLAIPLPPGADAVTSSESGPATIVQFIVPLDEQGATVAFYDEWTSAQPDEYQRIEAGSGGVSWQNDPEPGADRNIIAVLSPLDGDDFVAVTLTTGVLD